MNKAMWNSATDLQSFLVWICKVTVALYAWNTFPINGRYLVQLFTAKGHFYPLPFGIAINPPRMFGNIKSQPALQITKLE